METKAHIIINSGSMGLETKRHRNKNEPIKHTSVNPYLKTQEEYDRKLSTPTV